MTTGTKQGKALRLASAVFSNTGRKRTLNQDSVFHQVSETDDGKNTGLFLVCDGMGGRQGGEIASRIAVDTITDELFNIFSLDPSLLDQSSTGASPLAQQIEAAINKAHAEIQVYAEERLENEAKIGTTVTLAVIHDRLAHIANVGDGRAYAWREGTITQITRDHSFAAKLAEEGVIDEADVPNHPRRKMILRALGTRDAHIEVDLFKWDLRIGDKLLLCTDGLWQAFGNKENLAAWLGADKSPAELSRQLVNEAKYRDGSDNISAAIVTVDEAIEC